MPGLRLIGIFAAVALAALPGGAAAKDNRDKAWVSLPIVVEAATEPVSRVYSFRQREFFGGQPVRYRSAVTLERPVPLHELGSGAAIPAGKPLFELEAKSGDSVRSFYCTGRPPHKKLAGILCLTDRDGDGRMDELWTVIGSTDYLVPLPPARLERSIAPVKAIAVEDRASLALQLGFYVSGTNPIVGAHHFYPMLSRNGEVGYVIIATKNSVTVRNLPNVFRVGDAQISLEGFAGKVYRARVTRPYPQGELTLSSSMSAGQTIYISVPR